MIKIEKVYVMNFENAIRGARNPMNSWNRMDSYTNDDGNFIFGKNDLDLARRLTQAGRDHRKFLRQIFVSVDITAPLYWWKEFDTYKVGTTANSTSTMHKIHSKTFDLNDFSTEKMLPEALKTMHVILETLETLRLNYIETKDKDKWYSIIQLLPSSYNQKRTCSLNYEILISMYLSRQNHKLSEWNEYCAWIETLPYFKELFLD